MFFAKFPQLQYDQRTMKDLSAALIIKQEIKDNRDLYFWYEIEEAETPESVAFDFYGKTVYNFVVLLMNDIVDPFFDWPLKQDELVRLCEEKYGAPSVTNGVYDYAEPGYLGVKHYEKDGITYQEGFEPLGSVAVSYIEYEEKLNDKKRRIKILYPDFLSNIDREIELLLNG